jgi:hypothetical protein
MLGRLGKSTIEFFSDNEPPEMEVAAKEALIEATILDIGHAKENVDGGLCIDFEKDGKKGRVVLGYTELGMWVDRVDMEDQRAGHLALAEKILAFLDASADVMSEPTLEENFDRFVFRHGPAEMTLSVTEVKRLPESVRDLFKKEGPKDVNSIIMGMTLYY